MIIRNYASSPNRVLKLVDIRRQTTVQRPQLIKINFKPYFYLVTGDKGDNQNILFLRLFNQNKGLDAFKWTMVCVQLSAAMVNSRSKPHLGM